MFSLTPAECATPTDSAPRTAAPDAPAQAALLDACLTQLAADPADQAAMRALYERTSASVYAFALSMLKNRSDAEDVLHDCYVLLYTAAKSYRSAGKPLAWILTIAKNLALKKLRARARTAAPPPEEALEDPAFCAQAPLEERMIVRACLAQLGAQEREIVVLHAVAGWKHREIAAFLALPLPTVLSKYRRALKKLREAL